MTSGIDPTRDQATTEAAALKDTVATEAADLGSTAKDEAKQVAAEAKYQAQGMLDESVSQLRTQAATGQNRIAEVVRELASEAGQMAHASDANGVVTRLAGDASRAGDDVASWLESRSPEDVLDDVRRFAARRPAAFLALAAGAGFLAGRFLRGLQSDAGQPRALESGRRQSGDSSGYAPSTYNQGQYNHGNFDQGRYANPPHQQSSGQTRSDQSGYLQPGPYTDTAQTGQLGQADQTGQAGQPGQGAGHLYSYSEDEQRVREQDR